MTGKTVTAKPEPVGTLMLEQIAGIDGKSISPETARHLLGLSFSRSQQQQVDALSQKARAGSITPAERAKLDEFIARPTCSRSCNQRPPSSETRRPRDKSPWPYQQTLIGECGSGRREFANTANFPKPSTA